VSSCLDRWSGLPDFPWDQLAPYVRRANAYAGGAVDLSVGTPVDPTPDSVQQALAVHANAPGYPTTAGIPELKETVVNWMYKVLNAPENVGFLPTIGSKEIVASLPYLLGVGSGDHVVIPEIAYPTYAVGAIATGATVIATDSPDKQSQKPSIVWINSPSNPTGAVLDKQRLTDMVRWAQSEQVVLISDECYFELGWEQQPYSILDRDINGGDLTGLLAVHSLSKRSNMAGYRSGFLAGDPAIVGQILGVRKHLGMMVPTFVQYAAIAAYSDSSQVDLQRERYQSRREALRNALILAGFDISHSHAGLYLWVSRGESCWTTVADLADKGIVVTPGIFYGEAGANHVRVALTATDSDIQQVCDRLVP
jgi:succinyldiaminopimelate transaminase